MVINWIEHDLPVVAVLPDLSLALAEQKRAILQAPPGAGKSTLVPLALMDQPWMVGKKILMLEPRRLAARACAGRMATLLGETAGETVGYRIRLERCMGPGTRIEIITEGILTRMIQSDPGLEDTALLIFDEFHERHIHGDLGLALALESAEVLNPDLRLLVMSATMDLDALSGLMADAPVILSEGRSFPVTTHYLPPSSRTFQNQGQSSRGGRDREDKVRQILPACLKAIQKGLAEENGDILVFLPGAAQIRAMDTMLESVKKGDEPIDIYPLFGNLSPEGQAAAIAPSKKGRRKIVLSTPIAETSLTIQGVTVVVDSGLANVPKYSPGRGLTRLETLPISKASADQRRGRAGRVSPGVCYRLWHEHLHQGLMPFNRPEILSGDLSSLVLELAQWGAYDTNELKWLDPPPESAVNSARNLLRKLGALDAKNRITDHGRNLLKAGIHPRLAHMVIRGKALDLGFMGCCLAAMAEERDFLLSGENRQMPDPDITLRLEILDRLSREKDRVRASDAATHDNSRNGVEKGDFQRKSMTHGQQISLKRARQILIQARHLANRFDILQEKMDLSKAGRLMALAFPDRIAKKRRPDGLSYLMASGSGAFLPGVSSISHHEYIVAVDLSGNPKNALIYLAAPYDPSDLKKDFQGEIKTEETVDWDETKRKVRAVETTSYGCINLNETQLPHPDPMAVQKAMIEAISVSGLEILPWSKTAIQFRHRVNFLKSHGHIVSVFADLPDLSDDGLTRTLDQWLAPFLTGIHSAAALKQVDLMGAIKALFTWEQIQWVETHAPTHITVPSGSRIPIRYGDENGILSSPVLAVRLQEMFGLMTTPTLAKGRIPLTLHLLSPAGRPVQITQDLENFWKTTYTEVKKDLMGRYPKHFWPEDPATAQATNRTKQKTRS